MAFAPDPTRNKQTAGPRRSQQVRRGRSKSSQRNKSQSQWIVIQRIKRDWFKIEGLMGGGGTVAHFWYNGVAAVFSESGAIRNQETQAP